ncbi:MAG: pyridoxamine 5'-phosphate oxidase family protein [Anaerocolumna sp.]
MDNFNYKVRKLFEEIGASKKMVLSTSLDNHVTSRMMSIIIMDNSFFFQTDKTFRKYSQIQGNNCVALCFDNLQIEGICYETGKPADFTDFCEKFNIYFKSSYNKYTLMQNERLFRIEPTFIQKWIYEEGQPFIEIFNFTNNFTQKIRYK